MKALKILASSLALAALAGCQNYTTSPVCSAANAVVPAGITGVYTISTQDEAFAVKTSEISVGVDGKGRMKVHGLKDDGSADEARLCEINGQFVQESFNAKVNAYEQSRLYVTGMGLTTAPLFFDKAALDAVGIPNRVIEVPDAAAKVLGPKMTKLLSRAVAEAVSAFDGNATPGLLIDNDLVKPEAVMARSYAAPVGLTFLRK